MHALKARVRDGRLVLDEPTALPDGTEVRVALLDGDELDEEDRAALEAALAEGEADVAAGRTHSEADLWSRLI
jgi:hypothetical protein